MQCNIAIIAGIAFGIVCLVKKDRPENYLYTQLNQVDEITNVGIKFDDKDIALDLETLISEKTEPAFVSTKNLLETGEYQLYKKIQANYQQVYDVYIENIVYSSKSDSSIEDAVLNSINKNIEKYYTGSTIKHLTGESLNTLQI